MAHRITAVLVDDLDGRSTADETVCFALDGVNYEIDLSAEHAADLRVCLQPWQEHGRIVGMLRRRRGSSTKAQSSGGNSSNGRTYRPMSRGDRAHARAIRNWAAANGLEISARGKIPDAVHQAFDEAHASV